MSHTVRSAFRNRYGRVWHTKLGVARWIKRRLGKKRRKAARMELAGSRERGLMHWESVVNW